MSLIVHDDKDRATLSESLSKLTGYHGISCHCGFCLEDKKELIGHGMMCSCAKCLEYWGENPEDFLWYKEEEDGLV